MESKQKEDFFYAGSPANASGNKVLPEEDRTGQDRTGQFRKSQRESRVPDQRHAGACSALSFHLGLHAGRSRGHRRGSVLRGVLFALPRFYGGRMVIFDNSS